MTESTKDKIISIRFGFFLIAFGTSYLGTIINGTPVTCVLTGCAPAPEWETWVVVLLCYSIATMLFIAPLLKNKEPKIKSKEAI